jgi:tRNA-dihydrouridine synthase B
VLLGHLIDLHEFYGAERGVKVARKHISWYTKGLVGSAAFRRDMNLLPTAETQYQAIAQFFDGLAEVSHTLAYESSELDTPVTDDLAA